MYSNSEISRYKFIGNKQLVKTGGKVVATLVGSVIDLLPLRATGPDNNGAGNWTRLEGTRVGVPFSLVRPEIRQVSYRLIDNRANAARIPKRFTDLPSGSPGIPYRSHVRCKFYGSEQGKPPTVPAI